MVTVSSPSKLILFGEHAVVYGQPAIAVPVSDVRSYVHLKPNTGGLEFIFRNHENASFSYKDQPDAPFSVLVRTICEASQQKIPDISITISSDIPIASGLGSGASISASITKALDRYFNLAMTNTEQNNYVYQIEKIFHGIPSGIDNTVIVYETPLFFIKDKIQQPLENKTEFILLIADTGIKAETHITVNDVRNLYHGDKNRFQKIFDEIGAITQKAKGYLIQGEWQSLGSLMVENHSFLQKLTVSSPVLDHLVQTALTSGALGAKLSGSGRGGNMIALVYPSQIESITQALLQNGATRVLKTTVRSSGE